MTFSPAAVHENATPDPNEVLVSGVDAQGVPRNVLLRNHAELRARLQSTPATLPNPKHATKAAAVATAMKALEALGAQLRETPASADGESSPAFVALTEKFEAATVAHEKLQAELEAIPPTVPNPDRRPIDAEAFTEASNQVKAEEKKAAAARALEAGEAEATAKA